MKNMGNSYKKSFEITNSMLDKDDYLKYSKILDLVQRACELHADELHIGFKEMLERGYIWVVIQNEITMFKNVKNPKSIEIETFIMKNRFVEYPRENHIIHDGEVIGVVRSIWMILDAKNFTLQTPEIYKEIEPYDKPLIDGRIPRVDPIEFDKLELKDQSKVVYSQIDHNNHLNNTYYADYFMNAFRRNHTIKRMQIEYLKQAFLDDLLSLYCYETDKYCYLFGYKDKEKIFAIKGEKYED